MLQRVARCDSHVVTFLNLNFIDDSFLKILIEEKIKKYLGNVTKIIDKKIFPLSAHINTMFGNYRLVYVGDSAHSIHPIAGQGWNLGVRDIINLLSSIDKGTELGLDIGSKYVCKQYHDKSFQDAFTLYQITDKLNRIFLLENSFIQTIRNFGFNYINYNSGLNNFISSFAMGKRI